jgi:exoribonuclease-2
MVYLADNTNWQGEGVVVGIEERKVIVLVPELALEARLRVRREVALNDRVRLTVREINVPEMTAVFRVG